MSGVELLRPTTRRIRGGPAPKSCTFVMEWWFHHPMTTATAQAFANLAFAKLSQWTAVSCDCKAGFGGKFVPG